MGTSRRNALGLAGAAAAGAVLASSARAAEAKGPQVVMTGGVNADGKVLVGKGFTVKKGEPSPNGDAGFDVTFDKAFADPVVVTVAVRNTGHPRFPRAA